MLQLKATPWLVKISLHSQDTTVSCKKPTMYFTCVNILWEEGKHTYSKSKILLTLN
jgi:hypothetical protein